MFLLPIDEGTNHVPLARSRNSVAPFGDASQIKDWAATFLPASLFIISDLRPSAPGFRLVPLILFLVGIQQT